jgi:peptidylprolyl isomerase
VFKKTGIVLLVILCLSIITITGCGKGVSKLAQNGDTVKVHYAGMLNDGSVFDSSLAGDPMEFTIGSGQVIEGFDKAVIGMKAGEIKKFTIPADQAYGPRNETLTKVVKKSQLPEGMSPVVGDELQINLQSGPIVVIVTEVTDSTITIDGNHKLAGKDLTFDITLVELIKADKTQPSKT